MKKILVIDDSALMRRVLFDIIDKTSEYEVAYTAKNGLEAFELLKRNSDIAACLCDINMPKMSGLELLENVNKSNINVPFVMISSSEDANDTITALELGAVEFIKKPFRILKSDDRRFEDKLFKALFMATEDSEMHLQGRTKSQESNENKAARPKQSQTKKQSATGNHKKLVAIVCSTGGPKALQQVVPKIPANLNAPVLIVQHMPAGFTGTLANRLDSMGAIHVKEAEEQECLEKGTVYIAKGGTHLAVYEDHGKTRIRFDDTPPIVGLKPCGNIMYHSICDVSEYDEIICVVLTGMGADGTKGIQELHEHKNVYVIAQDQATSTVYGMPRAIYESGLTDQVCGIHEIANAITKKVGVL